MNTIMRTERDCFALGLTTNQKARNTTKRYLLNKRKIRCDFDVNLAVIEVYYSGISFGFQIANNINGTMEVLGWLSDRIFKYFNGVPNTTNNPDNFKVFHEFLCDNYFAKLNSIRSAAGIPGITYGNAQKMINMVFKYLSCYGDYKNYADLFSHCHIPIDNSILCAMNDVYHLGTIPTYTDILRTYGISTTAKINTTTNIDKNKCIARFDGKRWTDFDKAHYLALVDIYSKAMNSSTVLPIGSNPRLAFDFHYWGITPIRTGTSYVFPSSPIPPQRPATPIAEFFM